MVWEPGFDEFPMSLSHYDAEGICSVIVEPRGPGSNELVRAKHGDLIGIGAPTGRPYTVESAAPCCVGGGTGLAPMLPLAKALLRAGGKVGVVIGGRSKADLLFEKQMQRIVKKPNLYLTTDDGSHGHTGYASDLAERLIAERKVSRVYTRGPGGDDEEALRHLCEGRHRLRGEPREEHEVRDGICGSCSVGKNLLCRDGAVLDSDALKGSLDEFGLLQRDPSGRYIRI